MTPKQIEELIEAYRANSDGAVTQEAARAAVERILFDVDVARRSGALTEINRAYRARRLAGNMPRISYQAFLDQAIAELVIAAARSAT